MGHTMTATLHIGEGVDLPLQAVTETFVILAKRGAGKTYTAAVMAEEMLEAGLPVVVIDPLGVHWGLRSSADGKSAGYPVVIFGGEHADVPLEESAGTLIADVLIDQRFPAVLDLSLLTKSAMRRFMTAFLTRLYHRNRDALHMVIDEADLFAPQSSGRTGGDSAPLLGAMEDLVRRGRSRGIGCTLITQRPAVLHKDVLSQAEVLIAMRMTGVRDVGAIDEWVKLHAEIDEAKELKQSLPSLPIGTAWVWSPGWLGILRRVDVRKRRTFDSSATPKMGETRIQPRNMAEIDLAALGDQIAATVERAKADDPKTLKARVAQLQRELDAERKKPAAVEHVEVPVLADEMADRLTRTLADLRKYGEEITSVAHEMSEQLARWLGAPTPPPVQRQAPAPRPPVVVRERAVQAAGAPAPAVVEGDVKLGKGERTVLGVLAEYPEGRTYNELAFLAGYSAKASTLGVILANLRRGGLVERDGNPVRATAEGLAAAGGVRERPTGQALLDQWLHHPRMGTGERTVLQTLIDNYPNDLSNDELCGLTGYSPTASTMGVILSKLRKLGLVEKGRRRVPDEFMAAIQ